ncbi:AAA family ATPase [Thalassorhabdomicrobium marinisediminis]|uniref:Chromosome segregation protein SMC n=1 Tax=Thalassorhabdomicrobium marinisediminis TaxID=2170577 RepID=A0A2T7FT93_9RHOB|nr:chromosome segregation protein SMC [Thalassorhabdomicrobium marinisediminis]PVA05373.1 chromosome segregation protein SMC [Thalassorhabdomicrobium marinisediminis]
MKIRGITLNNVRRFSDPARVAGIGDGLNVLCEPNEHGKSTLFDAMQALFFKPHGSRDKDVAALRPHAGGAPEVTVEVETADGVFSVAKRWFQKPAATVHRNGTLIAQSDAAEAWIGELLGNDAGGPSGLIWVRQGMTQLTGGSKKEQDAALEARRDLMTSVGEEVEAMTGGRRMDQALARCREELLIYATATGRPKASGPWKDAQEEVEALTTHRDGLAATTQELHDALAERARTRRDLRELEAPEAVQDRQSRLDAARANHAAAERHAQEVEAETRKLDMARLTAEGAQSRLTAFLTALTEQEEAAQLVAQAEAEAQDKQAELEQQRVLRDAAETALAAAQEAFEAAEAVRTRALRAQAARDGADRRRELEERIAQAEQTRSAMETAAADARSGPDAKTLNRLETLAQAHATAIATRDATVTQVIAQYAEGRSGAIRVGDTPLRDGAPLPLPRATRLTIDGVGTLEVRPGEGGHDDTSVEAAAQALRQALNDAGADDLDMARNAAAARAEAERRHGEAKAVLDSLAPQGIDQLRAALAKIPQSDADADTPDPEQAEAAVTQARTALEAARLAREAASERHADARAEAMRTETTLTSLRDRLKRAQDARATAGDRSEADLAAEAEAAAAAYGTAQEAYAAKAKDAPDLAATKAALDRAESIVARATEDIARLKPLLARLDERISRSSGDAVEERLAEADQQLEAAQANLARVEREVAVLTRLEQALEAARNEARERYFTPIAKELKPLLHLLWPEAELTWGEESLLPDTLTRNGVTEPIDVLSGGTQEQVALLVRLAFARMLSASGRGAPVILDDALVFTDDDRIERMFDALHRQASDLQIIVLTCRQRAFRDLGGKALRLAPLGTAGPVTD